MTCIIGMEAADGMVCIGADSAAVADWSIERTAIPKVFQRGAFLIGYTSSFRMGQVLQYQLEVRPQHKDETDEGYITCAFIEAVRECLKAAGYATVDNNVESGGSFLVGYKTGLYRVSSDYGLTRPRSGFTAVGCGSEYAIGGMAALRGTEPEERIRRSLEIAAIFSAGVSSPFSVCCWEEAPGREGQVDG